MKTVMIHYQYYACKQTNWQSHVELFIYKRNSNFYIFVIPTKTNAFCHRIRLPSVAYQSDNKTKQTCSKAFRKGPCALYFVECVITTPSLLREYQRWQTGERRCADPCSRGCSKPTTSCPISCRPPGHVTTLFVTLALMVFLAVRPMLQELFCAVWTV